MPNGAGCQSRSRQASLPGGGARLTAPGRADGQTLGNARDPALTNLRTRRGLPPRGLRSRQGGSPVALAGRWAAGHAPSPAAIEVRHGCLYARPYMVRLPGLSPSRRAPAGTQCAWRPRRVVRRHRSECRNPYLRLGRNQSIGGSTQTGPHPSRESSADVLRPAVGTFRSPKRGPCAGAPKRLTAASPRSGMRPGRGRSL